MDEQKMDMFRSKDSKRSQAGRIAAEEAAKDPSKSLENIEKAKKMLWKENQQNKKQQKKVKN